MSGYAKDALTIMNTRKSDISRFNLFYIFVCIVWPTFHLFVLKGDAAGRTIVFLTILAILLNLSEFMRRKDVFTKPAFVCWTVLVCFSMINAFVHGFYSENGTFIFLKVNFFHPFAFLVISLLELHRNKRRAMSVIWAALGVYLLIGIPFIGLSSRGRTEVAEIGNLFSLQAVVFLFVSSLLVVEKRIRTRLFIVLAIVVSAIILLSGTRKAFGAEVIILSGFFMSLGSIKGSVSVMKMIVIGAFMFAFVNYSINNSSVGERINETIIVDDDGETIIMTSNDSYYVQLVENQRVNDILVALLDDRAIQYELGLALFHNNFWTGIGLTNFSNVSGYPYRLHTEYIVQLCENGIIGFVLLILFYILIIRALWKNKTTENSRIIIMTLFGLLAILFLNFTAWSYCQTYAMIVYAITLTNAYKRHESTSNE